MIALRFRPANLLIFALSVVLTLIAPAAGGRAEDACLDELRGNCSVRCLLKSNRT